MQGNQHINILGETVVTLMGNKPTYRAAIKGYAPFATPDDIFQIAGSATRTVKISRIAISGSATAAALLDVVLSKRSSAGSGGTPTALTKVPLDGVAAASTSTVQVYTVAPTPGTLIGIIGAQTLVLGAIGTGGPVQPAVWEFGGARSAQPIILHAAAQNVCISLGGAAMPAGCVLDIEVEWTEESPAPLASV